LTRDTDKKAKSNEKNKNAFLAQQSSFYEFVQADPSLWKKDDLRHTRDFHLHILRHPELFPLDCDVTMESLVPSANQRFDISQVRNNLTPGFVESITKQSWAYDHEVEHPVVQVLDSDCGEV
jgi:hypothetical protein